jgi:hypothetical protein
MSSRLFRLDHDGVRPAFFGELAEFWGGNDGNDRDVVVLSDLEDVADAITVSMNWRMANMMLTAMIPRVIRFARRMSSLSSSIGIPDPPIVPMPPHSATAEASDEVDMRTDMPPWMTGIRAVNRPIVSSGSFTRPPRT